MDWIRAIANDFLNGFSANDIPVFLGRLFISAFIALLIKLVFKKKYKNEEVLILNHSVLLSIVVATCVPVAQFSISLGLIMAALIVAFITSIKSINTKELIYVLISLLFAASIGAGYVVYSLIGAFVAIVYALIYKD